MAEPSASAELGDPAYGSDPGSVTYEAGEAIARGDAVTIASGGTGKVQPAASGDTNTDIVGIAGEEATEDGDKITVYVEGRIVANCAGAVAAGDTLAASTTGGQLESGTGDVIALTDSGAVGNLSAGYNLGTNAAVVEVR